MNDNLVLNLSASQLRKAADLKERIDQLSSELSNLLTGAADPVRRGPGRPAKVVGASSAPSALPSTGGRRQMSAAGRARIAAAAKARWAKIKASGGAVNLGGSKTPQKRTMSAAGRARIAAAAKARWAKAKAAGKNRI
jgi:hypothetical protein